MGFVCFATERTECDGIWAWSSLCLFRLQSFLLWCLSGRQSQWLLSWVKGSFLLSCLGAPTWASRVGIYKRVTRLISVLLTYVLSTEGHHVCFKHTHSFGASFSGNPVVTDRVGSIPKYLRSCLTQFIGLFKEWRKVTILASGRLGGLLLNIGFFS